ncbi:MAG: NlpC/P60 family peptidoglycan endopeptidase RipA [Mycobacterium sp.]
MRRTPAADICRAVVVFASMSALLIGAPGVGQAEPAPTEPASLATLIADVAEANQRLQDLGAEVQARQEGVNKALVDVQAARDAAVLAQAELQASQGNLEAAENAIDSAQQEHDEYVVAAYMGGPPGSILSAGTPGDMIANASAEYALSLGVDQMMENLERTRLEVLNQESAARAAKEHADQAAVDAQASQDAAVAELTDTQTQFAQQQTQIDQLVADRDAAQARLDAARTPPAPAASVPAAAPTPGGAAIPEPAASTPQQPTGDRWDGGAEAAVPYGDVSEWDTTLPMVPSAFVSGDPIAIVNTVLQISATSAQVTADLGRSFLQRIGILQPTDTGFNNGAIPRVYGRQASEYVINRAASQIGVPYSWGGGTAAGASEGFDSGAGTVGFDCSGLTLYAFAGVGISLPHYSGDQYELGRQIPSSQMRRGDLIFYGPGGSQHVALYLGNGQMLEAPYTGSVVKVSPVRTSGMTPYVVRYIEY